MDSYFHSAQQPGAAITNVTILDTGETYPGTTLQRGSRGGAVLRMQTYLNAIGTRYTQIPHLAKDGIFGPAMEAAVEVYQGIFGLMIDGIIGERTWNSIVNTYHTLDVGNPVPGTPDVVCYPCSVLEIGSSGPEVSYMQTLLNLNGTVYTAIPALTVDGQYGDETAEATRLFQRQFRLSADGEIGSKTWAAIVVAGKAISAGRPLLVVTEYPGSPVEYGSSGDWTRFVQSYLSSIPSDRGGTPGLTVDGNFGQGTENAVKKFQTTNLMEADGIVGPNTWDALITVFNRNLTTM